MSYRKIIVAIDGSEVAVHALYEAIDMAKSLTAALCIVYVADEFPIFNIPFGCDLVKYQNNIRHEAEKILLRSTRIAEQLGVTPEIRLVEIKNGLGRISEKIIQSATDWHADLIVLGTHGRKGIERFITGSVAEEVARASKIPVLLVRSEHAEV